MEMILIYLLNLKNLKMQDNTGPLKRMNSKSLSRIMGAKDPIAFYVTDISFEYRDEDVNEDDANRVNIDGLIIFEGDIDNMYNFSTIVYSANGLLRWDGINTDVDGFGTFIEEFVKGNEFVQDKKELLK